YRFRSRYVVRWPLRLLFTAFSLLIAFFVIWAGIETRFTLASFVVLALCAYFPIGLYFLNRLLVAWRYRRHPELIVEHTATFTTDSVLLSSVHADVRLNWDRLAAILTTPRGLLFLLPPYTAWFWLPQRLFEGNSKKDHILNLASEHKVRIK